MKKNLFIWTVIFLTFSSYYFATAHCDTMDGPVIGDARKAIDQNNVNYVLKWVSHDNEKEIREAFTLTMKVRNLSPDAKQLSERYFFETLVRIHRSGEGVPYTGVKPAGTPIDEKILAADKSIEAGNLSPLEKYVPKQKMPKLKKHFDKMMALKNYDVNDVKAGRKYVEAYVHFFHFAEGEHVEGHEGHEKNEGHEGHEKNEGHEGHEKNEEHNESQHEHMK